MYNAVFRRAAKRIHLDHVLVALSILIIGLMAAQVGASVPDPMSSVDRNCALFYHDLGAAAELECRLQMTQQHALLQTEVIRGWNE